MNKYLIKITGEQDLFYDSEDRVYKYRMHCPYCSKESGCRCFETLGKAEDFMDDSIGFMCSNKCSLINFIDEFEEDDVRDTMKEMGIIWRLKWYIFKLTGRISENDAYEVLEIIDLDYDSMEGEAC